MVRVVSLVLGRVKLMLICIFSLIISFMEGKLFTLYAGNFPDVAIGVIP